MSIPDEALALAAAVHTAQKSQRIWLADHPFVQAVRGGIATQEEIGRWAQQLFCLTRYFDEIVQRHDRLALGELNVEQGLDMLLQLGDALGLPKVAMVRAEPNPATQKLQEWMRQQAVASDKSVLAQICVALVEGMAPEAGSYLAEGAKGHYGLKAEQIKFFTVWMRSKQEADTNAAEMLIRVPMDQWDFVRDEALNVSRLVDKMYNSIGDMWSSW